MMGLLINGFIVFVLMFVLLDSSADDFRLELSHHDDKNLMLIVYHDGFSEKEIQYSAMCQSSLGGLSFDIEIEEGNKANLKVVINDRCALDRKIVLRPFEVYGRIINHETFMASYNIDSGKTYIVRAKMCDYERDNPQCVKSNHISLSF